MTPLISLPGVAAGSVGSVNGSRALPRITSRLAALNGLSCVMEQK
jgi:hypothetical protein